MQYALSASLTVSLSSFESDPTPAGWFSDSLWFCLVCFGLYETLQKLQSIRSLSLLLVCALLVLFSALSSPYPLVYFRNRCNLHSNHARGGGGREGAGKRPCPLLPSSCLSPRQSPPPPRLVANRSPGIQRKLRSGHRSEESPCVTRPGSLDGVFGAVGVPPLEDLAAGTREM